MTLREAQTLVLRVLKQVMEEKLDQHNVQLAQVCTTRSHDELKPILEKRTGHCRQGLPHPR